LAQLLIRNLPDVTVRKLRQRAERAGKALEPYLRERLAEMAEQGEAHVDVMRRIASMSKPISDPEHITRLIREDRER
jgi:plasmid stability protein